MTLTAEAIRYAAARGISERTLTAMHVTAGKARFDDGAHEAIVFRYLDDDGEQVNFKARSLDGKRYKQAAGGKQMAYNWGQVRGGDLDDVWITEGEFDACALVEAGISPEAVISTPNGAPPQEMDDPAESKKYGWLLDAMNEGLRNARRYIICADNDDPGRAFRSDVVRVLGPAKTCYVDWPEGIKDANEYLVQHGPDSLRAYLHSALRPWPVKGLYRLSEIPEPAPLELWDIGFPEVEGKIKLAPTMLSVVTGYPGHGKALALDTEIPTPKGWVRMADLKAGDQVFDEKGTICNVTAVTPAMIGRPCFRLTFDDGSEIVADQNHQWLTATEAARQSSRHARFRLPTLRPRGSDQTHKRIMPSLVTTGEIAETLIYHKKRNHAVQMAGPAQYPSVDLPIDPYVLGVWLGDGSSSSAYLHAEDDEIYAKISDEGGVVEVKARKRWLVKELRKKLREQGLLGNKHIPAEYLTASQEQRTALLQGLMDTDGFCHAKDRQCEFVSTSVALAEGVRELACSLGIKAKMRSGRAKLNGRDCGAKYRVTFTTNVPVFSLKRKRNRQGALPPRSNHRLIVSCEPVESVPVKCIEVDSPSHLYLCSRSYIPTHNSHLFQNVWFNIARRYGISVAVFSAETRLKPFLRRNLRQFYWRRMERHLSDKERAEADDWIEAHIVFMDCGDEVPTMPWLIEAIEVATQRHGCRAALIDPWNKIEEDYDPREMNETRWIGRMLDLLIQMSRGLSIHTQIIAHPAKPDAALRKLPPDLYAISGSQHWNNRVDQGFCVHRDKLVEGGKRQTASELYCLKSRFEELGYPSSHSMNYDIERGIFHCTAYETPMDEAFRKAGAVA